MKISSTLAIFVFLVAVIYLLPIANASSGDEWKNLQSWSGTITAKGPDDTHDGTDIFVYLLLAIVPVLMAYRIDLKKSMPNLWSLMLRNRAFQQIKKNTQNGQKGIIHTNPA